jgi:pyridoxamine 5'-phosphate oxidase family protein
MTFSPQEVAYIRAQRLARVATAAADGQPDVVPVGFEFDGTYFYIGGRDPDRARRTRNIQAGNDKVALVIDDVVVAGDWAPRYLRVYGTVELVDQDTPMGRQQVMKISPAVSWSFNLDGRPLAEAFSGGGPHRTEHQQAGHQEAGA